MCKCIYYVYTYIIHIHVDLTDPNVLSVMETKALSSKKRVSIANYSELLNDMNHPFGIYPPTIPATKEADAKLIGNFFDIVGQYVGTNVFL